MLSMAPAMPSNQSIKFTLEIQTLNLMQVISHPIYLTLNTINLSLLMNVKSL